MADTANPFEGLPPNLVPNPPASMPEAPGSGDATVSMSPFREALDTDQIIANLMLDRPLTLWIPDKEKYPDFTFRIINDIPTEIAQAQNQGYRQVDNPELTRLFVDLVAGSDKSGRLYRPLLFARPRAVSQHIQRENRKKLRSLYAGMDPEQKQFEGKYVKNPGSQGGSAGVFDGAGWRIRV